MRGNYDYGGRNIVGIGHIRERNKKERGYIL
jgi:hypothetical protein